MPDIYPTQKHLQSDVPMSNIFPVADAVFKTEIKIFLKILSKEDDDQCGKL